MFIKMSLICCSVSFDGLSFVIFCGNHSFEHPGASSGGTVYTTHTLLQKLVFSAVAFQFSGFRFFGTSFAVWLKKFYLRNHES